MTTVEEFNKKRKQLYGVDTLGTEPQPAAGSGDEFIRQREALAAKLQGGKVTNKGATEAATAALGQGDQQATNEITQQQIQAVALQQAQQGAAQQQPSTIDARSAFHKFLFPTAQEGANRRQETFGTTSKIPPILAAGTIAASGLASIPLALGSAGGTAGATIAAESLAAPTLSTAATATAATTTGASIAATLSTKALLTLGTVAYFSNADLKDSDKALSESVAGADGAVAAVAKGEMSIGDAGDNLALVEATIKDLERTLKIASVSDPKTIITGGSKTRVKLILAKQHLARLRTDLLQADAKARANELRAVQAQSQPQVAP